MLHIFAEFDVAELQQLNSITVKLALCLCLGSKSTNFLDLMQLLYSS